MSEDGDYAQAWRPDEAGDKVAGKVVSVTMGPDMGYGPYPIVTLENESGEQAVHAFHTVLRTELARRRPKVGDDLVITYGGTRAPKKGNGNPFHVYRVVGGQEPEFDWASELPDGERPSGGSSVPPIAPAPVPAGPTAQERAAAEYGDKAPWDD